MRAFKDTVDNQHFSYSNSSNSPTYLWATNSNGSSFLAARGSISVNYANSADNVNSASIASTVTVNNSDSNSTYRMVWHSGNTLYSTAGIYCNPSSDYLYATGFYETSDRREKTNILNIIIRPGFSSIKLKQFNWKTNGKSSFGVIAQDVERIYPEIIENDSRGYKKINYDAFLILKVQDLQDKIDKLEAKLYMLEHSVCKR